MPPGPSSAPTWCSPCSRRWPRRSSGASTRCSCSTPGLTNTEAFAANAFFAVGQVIFEVPTGVVADTRGRRFSFLLGAATLLVSTLLYLVMWQIHASFARLGAGIDRAGPRVHVLLGRDRGLARRRAPGDGLRGQPRVGLRAGPDREWRGDARGLGARRGRRPGHRPRACRTCCEPRCWASRSSSRSSSCTTSGSSRGAAPARSPRFGASCAARSMRAGATRPCAG